MRKTTTNIKRIQPKETWREYFAYCVAFLGTIAMVFHASNGGSFHG